MIRSLVRREPVERAIRDEQLWGAWAAGGDLPSQSLSGVRVTRESAMQLSAVWASVSLISEAISSMPLDSFFRQAGTRKPFRPKPAWIDTPNPDQDRHQWVSQQLLALLLDGTSYVYMVRDRLGDVIEVWNVPPWNVRPRRENQRIVYDVTDPNGIAGVRTLTRDQMFHVSAMSWPGQIQGMSPIQAAMRIFGAGLGAQEFAERYYGQGFSAPGVVEHPEDMTIEQARELKSDFARMNGGKKSSGIPAVLTGGAKYNPISVNPEQAQFLETRQFSVAEIARFFRVPPHMVGDVSNSTSWGTGIEQQGIGFVTYTLTPWLERLEQAYTTHLMSVLSGGAFVKFNVNGLLRGDFKTRYEAYQVARNGGWASPNDIRVKEDEPPISPEDGGDDYLVPANTSVVGAPVPEAPAPAPQPTPAP